MNSEKRFQKDKVIELKNKIHILNYFIVRSEMEEPLEENENEWHEDFEEAIKKILFLNENGYLSKETLHNFNESFRKWRQRYNELGLNETPISELPYLDEDLIPIYKKHVKTAET